MIKTDKKVKKTDEKVKKTDKKTSKKCGVLVELFVLASMFMIGCASTGAQPSRSQTQNNDLRDCIVVIAASATVSNATVVATSEDGFLPSEIFTQTMKNEGSESNAPTATPTQKTDVSPKTDVNTTGGRSAGVLESIVGAFGTWLTTPGGKAAAADAANTSGGQCADGECSTCTDGSCSP